MILPNRIKMLFKTYSVHIFQISHQKDFSLLPCKSRYQKFLLVNSFQQEYIFFVKDSGLFFLQGNTINSVSQQVLPHTSLYLKSSITKVEKF